MSASARQKSLKAGLVVLKPIICLQTAAAILGPSFGPEHVLRDIKRGPLDPQRIEWAWDIATPARRGRDGGTVLRVFAACVPANQRARHRSLEEVLDAVFADIVPRDQDLRRSFTISATVLARRLACTRKHVLALAGARALVEVPWTRRNGRTGSPAITWKSITQFLAARRFQ